MAQRAANTSRMSDLSSQIEKTIEHVRTELSGIRSGRAHPALVEEVKVDAYGSPMRLRDIAAITVPEPKLLEIRVWDMNLAEAAAKALEESDLGTAPNIAGEVIRIALPPLTDERREQLQRLIGKICEEGRIALRNERDAALERLKKQEKAGELSEDAFFAEKESVEEAIKESNEKIEEMRKAKEDEISE